MTKKGIILLAVGAAAFVGKLIYDKKFAPKLDVDSTIEELREQNKSLISENENLKKEIEELKAEVKRVNDLRDCEMIVHKNNKTIVEDVDDYPTDPDEIIDYNDLHNIYQHLEYGTENDWDFHATDGEGDEEVVLDHLEVYFYADGKAFDEDNNFFDVRKFAGNLLSGMGREDDVRYIINHQTEELYKVTFVDQSSELPCPRPGSDQKAEDPEC